MDGEAPVGATMKTNRAGGLELSALGYGTWQFGSGGADDYWGLEFTDDMAVALLKQATAAGVTYVDTAADYAQGGSELQLGRALKALAPDARAKVVIGSKILPNNCGDVRKYTEETLARLDVPCVDLYMVHWPIERNSMAHFAGDHTAAGGRDYATTGAVAAESVPPSQRAFLDLMELQKEGKIKHIGVSNFGVRQLADALETGVTIAVNQLAYNLLTRAIEFEILPFCRQRGIGVLAYSPLLQGVLTGAFPTIADIPRTARGRATSPAPATSRATARRATSPSWRRRSRSSAPSPRRRASRSRTSPSPGPWPRAPRASSPARRRPTSSRRTSGPRTSTCRRRSSRSSTRRRTSSSRPWARTRTSGRASTRTAKTTAASARITHTRLTTAPSRPRAPRRPGRWPPRGAP